MTGDEEPISEAEMKKGGDQLPSLSQSLSYATSCLNKSFQYATVRAVDACECSRLKIRTRDCLHQPLCQSLYPAQFFAKHGANLLMHTKKNFVASRHPTPSFCQPLIRATFITQP